MKNLKNIEEEKEKVGRRRRRLDCHARGPLKASVSEDQRERERERDRTMADEEESLKPTWNGEFVGGLPSGKVSNTRAFVSGLCFQKVNPRLFQTNHNEVVSFAFHFLSLFK